MPQTLRLSAAKLSLKVSEVYREPNATLKRNFKAT